MSAEWERHLRRGTEIHEAAHAVVGRAQGQRIRLIVVRPRAEGLGGFVRFEPRTDASPLEAAIVDLTTTEAGAIAEDAELRFEPEPDRPTDEVGYAAATERGIEVLPDSDDRESVRFALSDAGDADSPGDEAAIAAIAAQFAPGEAIWLMALCRARAVRLIAEHRGAILALAAALARRPILDGPAAEAVIEAHERSAT